MTIRWLSEARSGDHVVARIGRRGAALIAEWPGIGRLTARDDGACVDFDVADGANPVHVEKIRAGMAVLLARSLQGKLGLHAAAIRCGAGAVLLVGAAGTGKSTLAAAMCGFSDTGLLADDATALEDQPVWAIVPSEAAHFLDATAIQALGIPGSATGISTGKQRVYAAPVAGRPVRLSAIFRLRFGGAHAPEARLLSPIDGLASLIAQTVRFAIDEPARNRVEGDLLVNLVSAVPVFDLTRPRDFQQLSATVRLVRDTMASVNA